MVRVDEERWLKTGVEYFEGKMHFSTVVTHGPSNWAIAPLPEGVEEIGLALVRRGDAVEIRYALDDGPYALGALVYVPGDVEVHAGAMCAAPDGAGFEVTFRDLTVTPH
jgi:regulation of enolase protein 1 (concanavalin A-like superfamily)